MTLLCPQVESIESVTTESADAPRLRRRAPRGLVGVVALGCAAGYLATVGVRVLLGVGSLRSAVLVGSSRMAGPVLVVVVVLIALAERRWPAEARPLLARAHRVDAAYLVGFALLVAPMLVVIETGFAVEVERHARFLLLGRLRLVPELAVVVAILVGMDAMNWCAHLANHRSRALWRLHALHHSQEEMSVLTTFRTHPLVHVSYLGALIPALVLGASGVVPASALIAYGCLVTLPHANLTWSFGPLGRIIVSPAYHRLHHRRIDASGRSVNFGFVLVCWDRLAGRAELPVRGLVEPTGISGRPVRVEQLQAGSLLRTVTAQLIQPFSLDQMGDA